MDDRAAPTAAASAQQRERAVRDPFVQKVKETVDGTLLGVWPAQDASGAGRDVDEEGGALADEMKEPSDESAGTELPLLGVE